MPKTWNVMEEAIRTYLKIPCGFVHDSEMITALFNGPMIDQLSAPVSKIEAVLNELDNQPTT